MMYNVDTEKSFRDIFYYPDLNVFGDNSYVPKYKLSELQFESIDKDGKKLIITDNATGDKFVIPYEIYKRSYLQHLIKENC